MTSQTIAEPEHPEQHPRADRPGRRLAREAGAAPRVDPERHEERDLREDPDDVEEALVALRPLDEVGAEDRVDVDRREREVVRHRRRVEEERAERERRDDERGEDDPQKASPRSRRRRVEARPRLRPRARARAAPAPRTDSGSVTSSA